MNDFWEWMKEKGYGERDAPIGVFGEPKDWMFVPGTSMSVRPEKQMLIGYMMEYIREKEGMQYMNIRGTATIVEVYNQYCKDIERVERDNTLKEMGDK